LVLVKDYPGGLPHPDLAVGLQAFYHHLPLGLVLEEVLEQLPSV